MSFFYKDTSTVRKEKWLNFIGLGLVYILDVYFFPSEVHTDRSEKQLISLNSFQCTCWISRRNANRGCWCLCSQRRIQIDDESSSTSSDSDDSSSGEEGSEKWQAKQLKRQQVSGMHCFVPSGQMAAVDWRCSWRFNSKEFRALISDDVIRRFYLNEFFGDFYQKECFRMFFSDGAVLRDFLKRLSLVRLFWIQCILRPFKMNASAILFEWTLDLRPLLILLFSDAHFHFIFCVTPNRGGLGQFCKLFEAKACIWWDGNFLCYSK